MNVLCIWPLKSAVIRIIDNIYLVCLRLMLLPNFREEYGNDILTSAQQMYRDAYHSGGVWCFIKTYNFVLVDLLKVVGQELFESIQSHICPQRQNGEYLEDQTTAQHHFEVVKRQFIVSSNKLSDNFVGLSILIFACLIVMCIGLTKIIPGIPNHPINVKIPYHILNSTMLSAIDDYTNAPLYWIMYNPIIESFVNEDRKEINILLSKHNLKPPLTCVVSRSEKNRPVENTTGLFNGMREDANHLKDRC